MDLSQVARFLPALGTVLAAVFLDSFFLTSLSASSLIALGSEQKGASSLWYSPQPLVAASPTTTFIYLLIVNVP